MTKARKRLCFAQKTGLREGIAGRKDLDRDVSFQHFMGRAIHHRAGALSEPLVDPIGRQPSSAEIIGIVLFWERDPQGLRARYPSQRGRFDRCRIEDEEIVDDPRGGWTWFLLVGGHRL